MQRCDPFTRSAHYRMLVTCFMSTVQFLEIMIFARCFSHLYGTAIQLDTHAHPSIVGHWVDFDQTGVEGWQHLVRDNGVAVKVS